MKIASQWVRRVVRLVRVGVGLAAALGATAYAQSQIQPTASRVLASLNAVDAGAVPGSQPMHLVLSLKRDANRDVALDGLLASLIDSSSSNFHKWLTPQQFATSYGVSDAQIVAAIAWAQAQGLTVDSVSAGHTQMRVTGTAAQVQAAFAVSLHAYESANARFYVNLADPSLPAMFATATGMDDLPLAAKFTVASQTSTTSVDAISGVLQQVDQNGSSILTIDSSLCSAALTAVQIDQYRILFRQAAAQGMTVFASSGCGPQGSGSFPASLPEVTAVASPDAVAAATVPIAARPSWQVAPGLPADALRYEPDIAVSSLSDLAQAMTTIVQQAGSRQGVVTANLYKLAPTPGLYSQPDSAAAGTWEAATGLGIIDLKTLVKVYPRGSAASFSSFAATSYSPIHGQPVTFSSTVSSGTGGATPTGTVSFNTATGTTLGTANLVNGYGSFTINTMAGGNYTIDAAYSGDVTYGASTSPTSQILIQPEQSALSASISGAAVMGGNVTFIITDTANSGVGQPSGPVTITLPATGSTYSGTLVGTTANSASATVSFPAPQVGTITLSINCTTTSTFSCYNPFTTTATIVKATPTLTISYLPNPPVSGGTITLKANVTTVGTAPAPTGNVVFSDNGTVLNAGALANGATTTTGIVPTSPTHSITATYDGDANYNTVTVSAGTTTAGPIATTTLLTTSATTVPNGQPITFTATITPASTGSTAATGSVQFYDGTTLIGTASLNGYVASINVNTLSTTANHAITAIYAGDANYTGSTSNTVTVAKATATIATTTSLTSSATTVTAGQSITFTATISPASSASAFPSGTVQFLDGATVLGSATLGVTTTVSFSISTLSATVNHTITAVYSGDSNYAGSTSPAVTVAKANAATTATTTTLTVNPTSAPQGTAVTLSATVAPTVNATAITGSVQFLSAGTVLCTASIALSSASCTTVALPIGVDSITAVYLGDTNYATSTSTASTVTITTNLAVNSTLIASISPAVSVLPGAIATVTAILNAPVGIVPAGAITATITGVAGGVYSTTLPGTANTSTLTVTIPVITPSVAGTYSVVVACVGTNFACLPVTLSLISSTTAKIGTTTVLVASAASVAYGSTVTLTATVTPASTGTAAPSGTVIFYNGSTAVGTGTLTAGVATGTATITSTTNSFTAVYSGDTAYSTSTSAPVVVTSAATPSGLTLYSNATKTLAGYDIVLTAQVSGMAVSGAGTSAPTPTGTVFFYDTYNGLTTLLGSSKLVSTGGIFATAGLSTTGLTVGTHLIYSVYGGNATYSTVTSSTITISETDYSVTATYPVSLNLVRGGSGTVFYTVNFLGGMTGSVSLSCVPPTGTGVTCSFSPTQVPSNGGPTVLTIATTAPTASLAYPILWKSAGGIVVAGLIGFLVPRRRRRLPGLLLALLALGMLSNLGCNGLTVRDNPGSNQTSGTPLGTLNLTINSSGTDGVSTINHTYSYAVNVQ